MPSPEHGPVLHAHLQGALVQKCPRFPDGSDPEALALPEKDSHGAHWDPHGIHSLLGSLLRLYHPTGLLPDTHLQGEELTGGILHY